jgi:RNA polymerase sigma factor (sigma-70 family)
MQELDDIALLREYVERDSEEAFAMLVARHINKVYSVALRHTGNPHQAEEITQAVFVILAKKSRRLGKNVILSGWLYQTARLTAVTFIRSQIRRVHREQEAYMQTDLNKTESDAWMQIAPLLDTAMAGLNESDRYAVVLRFFDGKSMKEVGVALGANEIAARKRVNRAVEKLQKFFLKRGITSTMATLAGAISAHSVQAAPATLAKTITAVAMTKGVAASGSTLTLVKGALKLMAWTKIQTAVAVGVVVLLVASGTGIYETHQYAQKKGNYFPRNVWTYAGYATPEATIKTFFWAKSKGDVNTVLSMTTPDVRQDIENKYFKNKTDQERSAILLENVKNVTGIQIQQKMVLPDGQVAIQLHSEGYAENSYSVVIMRKMDGEWKVSSVEDHN